MQVSDVMTSTFKTIHPDVVIRSAAELMSDLDVGILPVEEKGEIVGIVTDRDLVIRALALGCDTNMVTVRDVMSTDIKYCSADDDVAEAAQIMADNQIRRLCVHNAKGKVTGLLDLADIAHHEASPEFAGEVVGEISQPLH